MPPMVGLCGRCRQTVGVMAVGVFNLELGLVIFGPGLGPWTVPLLFFFYCKLLFTMTWIYIGNKSLLSFGRAT
ncbi:hypothetical protein RchiOBHm_Chr5g0029001 [Rosa chinensis]|uniref:Uncharacterized protein n=1 Tax=Rosa chinensis TaxID=74649 RepID=A0A2P6Q9I7_ROSCH|nr:hypothetical protein RchiOBHm_Chr5g0029001 [Rosa chinensis]